MLEEGVIIPSLARHPYMSIPPLQADIHYSKRAF